MHHLALLLSKFSLQVKISYQNVSYCACMRHCFHLFPTVLKFLIVYNTVTMHALDVHCFHFFSAVPNRFKYLQSACFKGIVYTMASAVSKRFKYRQNACFRAIVFKIVSAVIRDVPKSARLHALPCFQNCLCSSKISFQITAAYTLSKNGTL